MKPLRTALVQTDSGRDIDENLKAADRLLASTRRLDLIVLPEVFGARGSDGDYLRWAAAGTDAVLGWMRDTARRRRAWIAGGVAERSGGRVYNTCVVMDRTGRVQARYRKMHLFEARLEDGVMVREASAFSAGDRPVMVNIEGWRLGLAICYDLRFPELFRKLSEEACLFLVPSNFTQRTGMDHWEILVRARAIENQCFVVAPDQCGANPATGVVSYGNSMVAGPWGEVLWRAGSRPAAHVVTLDPASLSSIRRRIPVLKHRRL